MPGSPQTGPGEGSRTTRPEPPDAAANRRRSEKLRLAATEAGSHASALRAALAVRRGGGLSFRDQMAVWQETHLTLHEMEASARELAAERAEAEREVAEQTAWVRGQVESMLDAGWGRGELRDIGIGDEVLAQLGLRNDPRLPNG